MARIRRKITKTGAQPRKRERKIKLSSESSIENEDKKLAQDQALARQLSKVIHYTVTPAGIPPYDLEGDDLESIKDWVLKIKSTGNHTVQSCQYWVRYFYDPSSQKEKWKQVREVIEKNHKLFDLPNLPFEREATPKDSKKLINWGIEPDSDSDIEFDIE
jgi:hypothetical protein